ncbi:MAG: dihydroorotate dehydrogenase electron transfer subunit [Firmicutes bacterium]|nr:dihydroorotate dehydrogenase electron transfer subunit [Bacillota bacterium]
MKIYENAVITEKNIPAEGFFELGLFSRKIAEAACPGQFVMLYVDSEKFYLPRPISISRIFPEKGEIKLLCKIIGRGTEYFSKKEPGESIRILGPLGKGFPAPGEVSNPVIVGGGIGVAPVLAAAESFGEKATVFLGDKERVLCASEFESFCKTYLATESGSMGRKGNVVELLREKDPDCDSVIACGPAPMLKAVAEWAKEKGIKAYISLEERMACGLGACVGCAVSIKRGDEIQNLKVCKDGPVFLGTEVYYE